MNTKYGIVILAAGGSARMGRPKQLLPFNNKSLLQNVVDAAMMVKDSTLMVVTGAEHKTVEKELNGDNMLVTYNEEWPSGMASSIRKGVREIVAAADPRAIIISVCDQPFITNTVFEDIIAAYEQRGKGIIASQYSETLGTPALFSRKYFGMLERLTGDEGAKKIIRQGNGDVDAVLFEKGKIDIDTSDDYRLLVDSLKRV